MEEHLVMEREHMRVHEENKAEASEVRRVQPDGPDDVGQTKMGPAGQTGRWSDEDGHSQTKMGTNPDSLGSHPRAPRNVPRC